MAIIAKTSGTNFTPAPAGTHAAVCVDIVDLGILETTFGGKTKSQHKINIVWQIEELRDDGKPYQVQKRYTLSLFDRAGLRKDLESWRGKAFTPAELEGFDLEVLLGVAALLNVIHNLKDGATYANVATIMRLPKGMAAPSPRDYVRVCERQPGDAASGEPQQNEAPWPEDDVPF